MAFQKGHEKFGGRQAGSENKLTRTIKESFGEAFELLGGAQELFEWAKTNKTDFYKLASKLIPTEISGAISVTPQARVFPMGLIEDEQPRLPAAPKAMDSLH